MCTPLLTRASHARRTALALAIALSCVSLCPYALRAADEPMPPPAAPLPSPDQPVSATPAGPDDEPLAGTPPAEPAAPKPFAGGDRWHFNVAPYLWAASLDGDVRIGRLEEDVDLDFIDILKDLSLGAMLYAEARKQRYGAFTNMFFVRTRDDSSGTIDTDVTSDTAQIAVGGFYRMLEWQWSETASGEPLQLAVEPYAGIRWSYIRAEIQLSGGGAVNLPQADRSESFVDPIIGVRFASDLSERWLAFVSGDVGGFSVGSDYSWNAQGYIGYRMATFGVPTILSVGYRALHQKYKDGDFKWDITQHGPIVGTIFAF